MVKKITVFFILSFVSLSSFAQSALMDDIKLMNALRNKQLLQAFTSGDDDEDIDSTDINSFMIRSTHAFQNLNNTHLFKYKSFSIKSFQLSYNNQNNSFLPYGSNDGNMYPARGKQERFSAGANIRWGIIDINVQPEFLKVENIEQEFFRGNENDRNWWTRFYKIVANNIDDFRQFGKLPIETISLGQSRVGISTKTWSAGVSNENIWWGPGKRNSLIFTNNAAGFKHYYLKTVEPIKTYIGSFELAGVVGKLDTTKYTDIDQDLLNACQACKVFKNLDEREIDGITINYQPKWIPNFYIGYAYSRQFIDMQLMH